MADLDKNINQLTALTIADFQNALNKIVASRASGLADGAIIITELIAFAGIYTPTTQPALSGSDLILDMASNRQAIFEGRKSVGDLTIDADFNFIISNDINALVLSCVLSLTGTRIITFEGDVLLSNASTIGTWNSGTKELTLTTGTDDLIEFNLLRYGTSNWLLVVGEVNV